MQMIEFATGEVRHGAFVTEAACLVTPVEVLPDDADYLVKDGEKIELPRPVVAGIVEAIRTCADLESRRMAVDCSVFASVMMGGTYNPVPLDTYREGLHWQIEFGRWLGEEEIMGRPVVPRMVQFIHYQSRILPKHTAIQLPEAVDLYVQKIGHGLPVALTDAASTFASHRANCAATIDSIRAGSRDGGVLRFTNPDAASEPTATYRGEPK